MIKKNNCQFYNKSNSLQSWLDYLERISNNVYLDINKIKSVAKNLNLLTPKEFVFIVSGTNGKGTTCRTMEVLLLTSGYRVGVYSSPHFLSYIERVRIHGKVLTEKEHINSFKEIEKNRNNILLTYFEFSTLSALYLFKQSNLDVIILEVGVGGRLDATNIIDADAAIITNIAIDHTNLLGVDREQIGMEKAGIFRPSKLAIVGESDIPSSVLKIVKEKKINLLQINKNWFYHKQDKQWCLYDSYGSLSNLPFTQVPLPNVATALVALRASRFQISTEQIYKQLIKINLPGRFQIIRKYPYIIFDVAHNPHAANYLSSCLEILPQKGKVHALIGMFQDKDIKGTVTALKKQVDYWYCVTLNCPRGAKADQIKSHLTNAYVFADIKCAWEVIIKNAQFQDTILVCGSFVTVSQIMNLITNKQYVY
ncbi:bifunctional tetrahydrofolate synthase/dihydrofolate synthase [Candidatus Pantoea edessiphila]|uniref:Dihydrofolate synthase/folylpolyglutamate synthase n=1 Tax=Candidatus Pantoea edessiphila TaxID=2044610 RepID=A0A2P5SYH3_9GAMM|nr:bifunctional tetrahydrofolate synthase/dihydrofolate synthase [Candidatus Pantoea edessiphila]MBK4775483.1 bifunctional tetrahydrofolate synthase/dihydrofolate synthase [Pantoea sp. Edef]PPI87388.1 bifunctional tetrahydrofolate synthase/dihydrofolate synthase [Candidatus Pantoea edessiphila]